MKCRPVSTDGVLTINNQELVHILSWLLAADTAVALGAALLGLSIASPVLLLLSAIVLLMTAATLGAQFLARQDAPRSAVLLMAGAGLVLTLAEALLLPSLTPGLLPIPLVLVLLLLPYLPPQAIRRLGLASLGIVLAIYLAGALMPPLVRQPSHGILVLVTACLVVTVSSVALLLLWQFGGRLLASLHAAQAATLALEQARAELEQKVASRTADLRATNSRLSVLLERLHAGVLVEDEQRRIVLTNATFCQMFNIAALPGALVGADCTQLAEQSKHNFADPAAFARRMEAILRAQQPSFGEELHLGDGRTYERDYVPLRLDTSYAGHLWLYRDITLHKQSELALAQARDAALESSRLKSRFLATISHELRTPLNGVIGMSELLLGTPLGEEQASFVRTIDDSAQALLTIINDILDYSKIEADKVELDPVTLSIEEVVSGVVNILRPRTTEKRLAVVVEITPDIPTMVRGDAGRLRQILLNLLGNAVKFTEQGRVVVRVGRSDAAADDRAIWLRFSIQDTGIGIPASLKDHLFQPFTQADGSVTRRYGGSGLGLAISHSLVALMGGSMGYESVEGQGSTFWFAVPLEILDPTTAQRTPYPERYAGQLQTTQTAEQITLSGHVLLVEDHPVNQQIMLHYLAGLGLTVDLAPNGRVALEWLSKALHHYQAVLMDCQMPEMDGLACTQAIRRLERERGTYIPIIAMTASALPSDREACFAVGMDDFLSKPVRPQELATALARWLTPVQPPLLEQQAAETAEPAELFDPTIWANLQAAYARAPEALDDLLQTYFEEAAQRLAALRRALVVADAVELTRAAHALYGSSANLGVRPLADLAAQLEACGQREDIVTAAALLPRLGAAYNAAREAAVEQSPASLIGVTACSAHRRTLTPISAP